MYTWGCLVFRGSMRNICIWGHSQDSVCRITQWKRSPSHYFPHRGRIWYIHTYTFAMKPLVEVKEESQVSLIQFIDCIQQREWKPLFRWQGSAFSTPLPTDMLPQHKNQILGASLCQTQLLSKERSRWSRVVSRWSIPTPVPFPSNPLWFLMSPKQGRWVKATWLPETAHYSQSI